MRRLGSLLTLLALLAVQAPWVVCDCEVDGGLKPQLLGLFGDGFACDCAEHEDGHGHHHHGHAHHNGHHHHGHGHHHCDHGARHCHGSYTHGHGEDGEPTPSGHVAIRLPMGVMPALALLVEDRAGAALDTATPHVEVRPPGDPTAPSVRTERLLL